MNLDKEEKEEEIKFEMKMSANIRLNDGLPSPYQNLPRFHIIDYDDWAIDESAFIDFTKKTPIEKKPFFKKLKDNIVLAYYDFLLILWRIKQKKKRK